MFQPVSSSSIGGAISPMTPEGIPRPSAHAGDDHLRPDERDGADPDGAAVHLGDLR